MPTLQNLFHQMRTQALDSSDFFRAILQNIHETIGSTRASIWFFNEYKDSLLCELLFDNRTGEYSSGTLLHQEDFPEYFTAMVQGDTIAASDAFRHELTQCFAEIYFDPLEIKSLLDVSIIAKGKVIGVLCCEHCDQRKLWTANDIEHLNKVASMIALSLPMLYAEA